MKKKKKVVKDYIFIKRISIWVAYGTLYNLLIVLATFLNKQADGVLEKFIFVFSNDFHVLWSTCVEDTNIVNALEGAVLNEEERRTVSLLFLSTLFFRQRDVPTIVFMLVFVWWPNVWLICFGGTFVEI